MPIVSYLIPFFYEHILYNDLFIKEFFILKVINPKIYMYYEHKKFAKQPRH